MKTKAILMLAFAVALFVVPQAMAGPNRMAKKAAKAACLSERAELGREAFREQYGKPALRRCIREHMPAATQAIRNAAQECREERRADPEGFRTEYGTPESKGRNAFGKCVSQKAREKLTEEAPAEEAPAGAAPAGGGGG